MMLIAGNTSTKNTTDGETAAVVVVVVVVVDMALTQRLTNRPNERQTGSNSVTTPRKICPHIGDMASQGRAESD